MLLTTTDTLPSAYTPLGLVTVTFIAAPPTRLLTKDTTQHSLQQAYADLEAEAQHLGADAVIAICIASMFGNNNVLMGTAVKYRPAPLSAPPYADVK